MNADERRHIIDHAGVGSALIRAWKMPHSSSPLKFEAVHDEHQATSNADR
jgi:HD-like signal output (HDOD) protein